MNEKSAARNRKASVEPEMTTKQADEDVYAFLVVYGKATIRFNVPVGEAEEMLHSMGDIIKKLDGGHPGKVEPGQTQEEASRSAARDLIRLGMLDNDHLNPKKSQGILNSVVWLCLTSASRAMSPESRGFVIEITERSANDANFRFMFAPDAEVVDDFAEEVRRDLKYVVRFDPEDVKKALSRKRTVPRDPSLDPPPKPRPEHWLPALVVNEKTIGRDRFVVARDCLENGNMFVWKSHQIADASVEEINASLQAMAEYNRLHLPFRRIWAETRDWLEIPQNDGPMKKVSARFAIAADEYDGMINFWGFSDVEGTVQMSLISGQIDINSLEMGVQNFIINRPDLPDSFRWDESAHRRIIIACGEHLLELLFLLSTNGVVKQHTGSAVKPGKKRKEQRRMTPRDYTVVRVPMTRASEIDAGGTAETGGVRWVRPHVRRAHMWGKNVRPPEEQRWVDACLVGAARTHGAGVDIKRREYRLS